MNGAAQLFVTARSGDVDTVKLLLKSSPALFGTRQQVSLWAHAVSIPLQGQLPLHVATEFGQTEVVSAIASCPGLISLLDATDDVRVPGLWRSATVSDRGHELVSGGVRRPPPDCPSAIGRSRRT